jgi:hypothetical protein
MTARDLNSPLYIPALKDVAFRAIRVKFTSKIRIEHCSSQSNHPPIK